ncbi:MFS transporter [Sulfurovum mangrovi]|uniref:MFS transporter n=1 Tax=Sulfurovum mangrovi TaxID=2893889 RepID=UPI001E3121EA|nr:MFS transporter [Sulfurovum mangrovi]UFH58472.1 MFS transporter [Sulfurovum mangrovi]
MKKRSIYAWALYDWANSAYVTTVIAGFFPVFFKEYFSANVDATVSTAQLGFANSISSFLIVLMAPFLGAIADIGGLKKRFLFLFSYLGILMSAALSFVGEGAWEAAVFVYIIGNIGFMGSNIFYDSLLPTVAGEKELDRVSGLGFALGYLGGGILFALDVWMVQNPALFGLESMEEGVKVSFLSVALWWMVFSLPLFLFVKEEKPDNDFNAGRLVTEGYQRLKGTIRKVVQFKGLVYFLVAYWFYIDGVDTIIRMAVDYGMAIGFEPKHLILSLLIVQFVGFPATLLFAKLGEKWGTKKAILLGIGIYLIITLWAAVMEEVHEFYLLAVMIALAQGGIQALSRSYYARMIPDAYAAEFFGFYNFLGKTAAILGPLLIGTVALFTESSRAGIISVVLFFIVGGIMLLRVDEKKVAKEVRSALG